MSENGQQNLAFDSERQHLGSVYAKALLSAAESAGGVAPVLDEYDAVVHEVLDKLPKLESVLSSTRVGMSEKEALIDKAFPGASKTMLNFLKVVASHGRFDCIRVIHSAAHAMNDEAVGRVEVTLTTASEIDHALRDRVATKLAKVLGREVRVKSKIDPEILGGLVVRVGDTVYDGSLANQLQRVRRSAVEHAVHEIRQSLDRFVVEA